MLIRFAAEKRMEDFCTGSQDQRANILDKESRGVITMRRAHKWAQNVLNLRLKVISFAIMTPSEQFYVS